MVLKGFVKSREQANSILMTGNVFIDKKRVELGVGESENIVGGGKAGASKRGEESGGIEEFGRSRMDDPVRMYLRQMGQIPLLTRQEEIAIAKKIEDCEDELKRAVYGTRASRFEMLELARKIINEDNEIVDVAQKMARYADCCVPILAWAPNKIHGFTEAPRI